MGNDGGSIPTRRELVKEAASAPSAAQQKETRLERQTYLWNHDPISKTPLKAPIVSDCRGRLFNKSTVLEFLVEGKWQGEMREVTAGEVGGLRDVIEVRFPGDDRDEGEGEDGKEGVWRCPVTNARLGAQEHGGVKAAYVVPCGHAFAASALKEVGAGEGGEGKLRCLACEGEYAENDVVSILPVGELEVARLEVRIKRLREQGLSHCLKVGKKDKEGKKEKKRKHAEVAVADPDTDAVKVLNGAKEADVEEKGNDTINNTSAAKIAAKVVADQEKAKKRKLQTQSETVSSLFSKPADPSQFGRNVDYMTRGFTVPANAKR